MSDPYAMKRIGWAETEESRQGRHDRYNVHAVNGDTITVTYAGYREGSVTTGLPLGGPDWTPPNYVDMPRDGFETVVIF